MIRLASTHCTFAPSDSLMNLSGTSVRPAIVNADTSRSFAVSFTLAAQIPRTEEPPNLSIRQRLGLKTPPGSEEEHTMMTSGDDPRRGDFKLRDACRSHAAVSG